MSQVPTPVPYSQTDLLHGQFTWGYQFTLSGVHWQEFSSRFGTTDILSDPQFQLQPHDQWQPLQLAVNMNILNQTWPRIGPLIVSTALQAGYQWTDGQGGAATITPQLDLSTVYLQQLHLQGAIQLNNTVDGQGHLHSQVQIPLTTVGLVFHW